MNVVIQNTTELKLEIARLEGVVQQQEFAIKQHFNSPRAILGTVTSLFNRHKAEDDKLFGISLKGGDLSKWVSRLVLPLALNKTLFRKSNFIVKALVGILAQRASGLVDDKKAVTLWDKVKGILPDKLTGKTPPKQSPAFNRLPPALKSFN